MSLPIVLIGGVGLTLYFQGNLIFLLVSYCFVLKYDFCNLVKIEMNGKNNIG